MTLQSVPEIVRKAEKTYLMGGIKQGKYVNWDMHDTIEKITAYLNSVHTSGPEDSLGREKPFFNIVTAATNVWYRATDIDRKDIKFVPKSQKSVPLAFVANILLQRWMNDNRFGVFLNDWGRSLARYGSSVVKFVERNGELIPSVIAWDRLIVDSVDFEALPVIEKLYKTEDQLINMATKGHPDYAGYDMEVAQELIAKLQARRTLDKNQQDTQNDFVEIYEVHGELDSRLLMDEYDEEAEPVFVQQMHVFSYVKIDDEDNDYCLYKGKEKRNPYMLTHLIKEDGRTLGIGAVEHLFDSQWMQNHTMKNMKDTLDLSSKLIFQTSDSNFIGRNVLSSIETGDILINALNQPLTQINNSKQDVTALQNFSSMWSALSQDITSTPDAIRGNTMPSGTPYSLAAFSGAQANSLFELMTENKGLSVSDMASMFIIPNLKRTLKHREEILAILDDAGITEIDQMYVPVKAIQTHNENFKKDLLAGNIPQAFDKTTAEASAKQDLMSQGNKRSFVPSDATDQQWADLFSDFEWDSVSVEVTNENTDKQAVLTTLNTTLQTIAQNPAILQDSNAKMVFNAILTETGRLSPLQLSQSPAPQPVSPSNSPLPTPSQ